MEGGTPHWVPITRLSARAWESCLPVYPVCQTWARPVLCGRVCDHALPCSVARASSALRHACNGLHASHAGQTHLGLSGWLGHLRRLRLDLTRNCPGNHFLALVVALAHLPRVEEFHLDMSNHDHGGRIPLDHALGCCIGDPGVGSAGGSGPPHCGGSPGSIGSEPGCSERFAGPESCH